MVDAQIVPLARTVKVADWQQARAADPFVRVASVATIDGDAGTVAILDSAVLCGNNNCLVTMGAYPPERSHPANRVTGRGRWVHLLPVYYNRGREPFYKARETTPDRAHTDWNEEPDTPDDLIPALAALNVHHHLAALATVVPFGRFRVKCHACGTINTVEVPA